MEYTMSKAREAIKSAIRSYLLKDDKGHYVMDKKDWMPLYLMGAPGVGKTQSTHEIAVELGIGFVSFSLTHHTRNSLLGLPVISELSDGSKYTTYTMSEIIEKVEEAYQNGEKEGILLLDEFPCVSETIMPAMLSFLQSRNIGMHYLPEGWIIVLCGNPPKYNKSARLFDAAVMDRVRIINIEHSAEDFLNYGKERGIHEVVLEFIEMYPSEIFRYEKNNEDMELVTARSWENLSSTLKVYEAMGEIVDVLVVGQYIKSDVLASKFINYYEQYSPEFSAGVIDQIICGSEKISILKAFKKEPPGKRWKMTEYILSYMKAKCSEDSGKLSDSVGNIICFLEKAEDPALCSRAYRKLTTDKAIMDAVTRHKNVPFKRLCERVYKGGKAV